MGTNRYTSGYFQGAESSGILYNERNPAARYKMCGSHQADRRRARLLCYLRNKGNEKNEKNNPI